MTQHDRETLLALAVRAEKATGGDRELDLDCWWWGKANGSWSKQPMSDDYRRSNLKIDGAPRYSSSLDAAMSLVPEGWEPIIDCRRKIEVQLETIAVDPGTLDPRKVYATGATPALALCAAALRARATLDGVAK